MSISLGSDVTKVDLSFPVDHDYRRLFVYKRAVPTGYVPSGHTVSFTLGTLPFSPVTSVPLSSVLVTEAEQLMLRVTAEIVVTRIQTNLLVVGMVYPYTLTLLALTGEYTLMAHGRVLAVNPRVIPA